MATKLTKQKYVVCLKTTSVDILNNSLDIFWNTENLFTLEEAKDCVAFQERIHPENIGNYKIYELKEVI